MFQVSCSGTWTEEEKYTLKASECKMVFEDCYDIYKEMGKLSNEYYKEDTTLQEKRKLNKAWQRKNKKFMEICNNQIALLKDHDYPYMLATTCDTWQGNSGGGYISTNGKYIYGIVSGGNSSFDAYNTNYATSSKQFDKKVKELIKTYDSKNSVEENIAKIPTNLYGDKYIEYDKKTAKNKYSQSEVYINTSIATTEELEQVLKNLLSKSEELTDDQILQLIDVVSTYQIRQKRIEELQKAYKAAKEKEQSLANRTLTAVTTAAMGIGGME